MPLLSWLAEHVMPLVIGLLTGLMLLGLLLRHYCVAAREEISQTMMKLTQTESLLHSTQLALEQARAETNRFEERASRIPPLEEELGALRAELNQAQQERLAQSEKLGASIAETEALRAQRAELQQALQSIEARLTALAKEQLALSTRHAELTQTLADERTRHSEKLALLDQAKLALSDQFKTVATELLDEKSKKFTEQNQTNLDHLLSPLRQQLTDFRSKVEEINTGAGKERHLLASQISELLKMNQTLKDEAHNLTQALTGNRKTQGNFGEIILDDVLEKAGLKVDVHYTRQTALRSEDGQTKSIPDVVINLPQGRHIVVDSKFTLPDYRAFANAESDSERNEHKKRFLEAISNHIKGLSARNYQTLYGLQSLDFVVMFVPLEPAFLLAVSEEPELFSNAWALNVLLVSPSTLLFVVRTIAHLWRQDALSQNALEISRRGATLYDKLHGFVEDLQGVGTALDNARSKFENARKKLHTGTGNLIRQAEMLKDLGVKPAKQLASPLVDSALEDPLEQGQTED